MRRNSLNFFRFDLNPLWKLPWASWPRSTFLWRPKSEYSMSLREGRQVLESLRPLAQYSEPCPCPVCGRLAPRNSISTPLFFSKGSARTVLRAEAHSKRYGFVACQCCRKWLPFPAQISNRLARFSGGGGGKTFERGIGIIHPSEIFVIPRTRSRSPLHALACSCNPLQAPALIWAKRVSRAKVSEANTKAKPYGRQA